MPDLELEPHEFRPTGRPRLWGRRMVVKFAILAAVIEVGVVTLLLSRPDLIDPNMLLLTAVFSWPWIAIIGAAIGHLVPQFYFQDDKQD